MKKTTKTPTAEESTAACGQAWDVLIPTRAGHLAGVSPHYDEVFDEVAQRTQQTGSLGKTDSAALVPSTRQGGNRPDTHPEQAAWTTSNRLTSRARRQHCVRS